MLTRKKTRTIFVTTSIKKFWRAKDVLLIAGDWCLPPGINAIPSPYQGSILPYRWDDHDTLHCDLELLDEYYENILEELSALLNKYHNTFYQNRYWRIILGPWLYTFIHTMYFKWTVCEAALRAQDSLVTHFADIDIPSYIPNDFADIDPDDLFWQHLLFAEVIKAQGKIKWSVDKSKKIKSKVRNINNKPQQGLKYRFSQFLSGLMVRPKEFFLTETYQGFLRDTLIQLRAHQIPRFWKAPPTPIIRPDMVLREQLQAEFKCKLSGEDAFSIFMKQMSVRYIPTAYLEGYKKLGELIANLKWPVSPPVIFTSNAFQFSETFKRYAAAKVEDGSQLVIGQHGGFYGLGKFVAGEKHQVEISNKFLTWGWKSDDDRVVPMFAFVNPLHKPLTWNPHGCLLLVTVPIRRSVYKLSSWPTGARQSNEMLQDQLNFADLVGQVIRKTFICRIFTQHDLRMGTGYNKNWQKRFPEIQIDDSQLPIERAISKCRLFVYTYNSTGLIESLVGNVPTIFFWRPERWHLRNSAKTTFEELRKAKIFHETPESAAIHVEQIWDDVSSWWFSDEVQKARNNFCSLYCRKSKKPDKDIYEFLNLIH